jgi:hypothetical protein
VFTSNPFVKVIFNLGSEYISREGETNQKTLTTVKTRAMVANESISSSKNSGCITPSSFFPLNHALLTSVWMTGASHQENSKLLSHA